MVRVPRLGGRWDWYLHTQALGGLDSGISSTFLKKIYLWTLDSDLLWG